MVANGCFGGLGPQASRSRTCDIRVTHCFGVVSTAWNTSAGTLDTNGTFHPLVRFQIRLLSAIVRQFHLSPLQTFVDLYGNSVRLTARGEIAKLDPQLPSASQAMRMVHVGPKLQRWMETVLPGVESTWKIEQSPVEQLDDLMQVFCSGSPLTNSWQFESLTHVAEGVWGLKTADIRRFGWFHPKCCFIAAAADTADRIKTHKLHEGYGRIEVINFRKALDRVRPQIHPRRQPA
ncbi:MAG: hypothetical protein FWD68_06145 [Alphaproteobacteria bacterium]|nr:hypothetical protein [Alphaproteobacteria bacterium]